jgi:hypothetical protein
MRLLQSSAHGASPAASDPKAGAARVEGDHRAASGSGLDPIPDFHSRTDKPVEA